MKLVVIYRALTRAHVGVWHAQSREYGEVMRVMHMKGRRVEKVTAVNVRAKELLITEYTRCDEKTIDVRLKRDWLLAFESNR